MLRIWAAYLVLVCLLLQWIPDSLHILVHAHEKHTQHASPLEGELAFDSAHKHCKNPEKAMNSAWIQSFVSIVVGDFSFLEFASLACGQQPFGAFDFKSGRAPPAA